MAVREKEGITVNSMKIKATFQQEVYVDPAEAFEQIKAHLGFAPYRAFVTIKDGELMRGEDVSHHGSPDYEYETISNNPKWLELYKSVQCLDDYFHHSQEPQWQQKVELEMEEDAGFEMKM